MFETLCEDFPSNTDLITVLPSIKAEMCTLVIKLHKGLVATVAIFPNLKVECNNMVLRPGLTLMNASERVEEDTDKVLQIDRDVPEHSIWTSECASWCGSSPLRFPWETNPPINSRATWYALG